MNKNVKSLCVVNILEDIREVPFYAYQTSNKRGKLKIRDDKIKFTF